MIIFAFSGTMLLSHKLHIIFLCYLLLCSGVQVQAAINKHQHGHLASILAGGLISLILREASEGRSGRGGGGLGVLRSALGLPKNNKNPSQNAFTNYRNPNSFGMYGDMNELPYYGLQTGALLQSPDILGFSLNPYIGGFLQGRRYPKFGLDNANPYLGLGLKSVDLYSRGYDSGSLMGLDNICNNLRRLRIQNAVYRDVYNSPALTDSFSDGATKYFLNDLISNSPKSLDNIRLGLLNDIPQNSQQHYPEQLQKGIFHNFQQDFNDENPPHLLRDLPQDFPNHIQQDVTQHYGNRFQNNFEPDHPKNIQPSSPIDSSEMFGQDQPYNRDPPIETFPQNSAQFSSNNYENGQPESVERHLPNDSSKRTMQGQTRDYDFKPDLPHDVPQSFDKSSSRDFPYQNPEDHARNHGSEKDAGHLSSRRNSLDQTTNSSFDSTTFTDDLKQAEHIKKPEITLFSEISLI